MLNFPRNFQHAVDFYDAVFKVPGYARLPAWTESWAIYEEMEIIRMRNSVSAFVRRLITILQRRVTGRYH